MKKYNVNVKGCIVADYVLAGLDVDFYVIKDLWEDYVEELCNFITKYFNLVNVATSALAEEHAECIPPEGCTVIYDKETGIRAGDVTANGLQFDINFIVECIHEIDKKTLQEFFLRNISMNIVHTIFYCGVDHFPLNCQCNPSRCAVPKCTLREHPEEVNIPFHLNTNNYFIEVEELIPKCLIFKPDLRIQVDNQNILLRDDSAIEYFIDLYTKAGYTVVVHS